MDWLSIAVAALILVAGLMDSRKKKQKKEAKQAQKAHETRAKMADGRKNVSERPPRRSAPGHPYAESPKEQGMTLDDFRRKYDSARKKAEAVKEQIEESLPEGVGSLKEGRGSTEGRGYTEGRGSSEGTPRRPRPRNHQKQTRKAAVNPAPAEMAANRRRAPEKTIAATPIQTVYQEKNSGYDQIAEQLQRQKLSPLQQAVIWSEILGPPKAKRPSRRHF